ncbi:MAG: 4-carboxymuconolactone decarboxylase [Mycobacterium sp.]|jgi:hypothetical protein|nr:4-carboxymuconolactone decarboxylase [Mycobacterium sp.]
MAQGYEDLVKNPEPIHPRAKLVSMTNLLDEGLQVFRELLPGVLPDGDVDFGGGFAPELMDIGIENIFGRLWTRRGSAAVIAAWSRWASSSLFAPPTS